MEPCERRLALEAISVTLAVFQGSDPLFSVAELAALRDKDARYGLMDLREAVRGMNAAELRHLSAQLDERGLSLTQLVLEFMSTVSSIARKKVWSEADLILLSAARDVLLPDQKERLRLQLPGWE